MLPLFLSSLATFLFGCYAVFLSQKNDKTKRELESERGELARKLYEASILARVASEIGYSLSTDYIAKIIAETAENLYEVSTTSFATIKNGKVAINTIFKENIGEKYIENLNRIIVGSINNIDARTKGFPTVFDYIKDADVAHTLQIDIFSKSYAHQRKDKDLVLPDAAPRSYFNVPLVVDNGLVGLINISSRKKAAYQDKDMSILYKIVNASTQAIERLRDVIETEKGKLESLISGISSGVVLFSIDPEGYKIQNINNSAKEFLKLRESVNIGDVFSGFDSPRFGPPRREAGEAGGFDLKSKLSEVTHDKKSMFFQDVKIHNHFFKIFLNPVFSAREQKLTGATVTMRDITLEKEIEALRQNFMNMVVHELRSPLTSIKGASGLLENKNLNEKDKEKMIEVIKDSSETMLSEIGDLLDASKIEAGKLTISKSENDLNKLIHARAEAFSYLANDKGLKINLNLEVGIPKFDFDSKRVGQVINNLLSNSIKFTPARLASESVAGRPTGGTVTISCAAKTRQVTISVADTGIGIANEKKGLLFSKFGQTGQIFNKDSTGLGLYISKGIVESHGGKIWVESEEGRGTTVFFTLPMEHESMIQKKVRTENKTEVQAKSLIN